MSKSQQFSRRQISTKCSKIAWMARRKAPPMSRSPKAKSVINTSKSSYKRSGLGSSIWTPRGKKLRSSMIKTLT